MKISRILFQFKKKKFVEFFCNVLFVKKIIFEIIFRKEFFSVNFFRIKIFLGTLIRKFSFHKKIGFRNFLILNYFFFTSNNFQNFYFFRKKC